MSRVNVWGAAVLLLATFTGAPAQTLPDSTAEAGHEVVVPAPAPSPADSVLEAQTKALASQLRCPVCQGLSIEDSPTELSHQMKGVIREQLRGGSTPEQVKAYFVARYGEWILLRPTARGFNLAVYLLPLLAVVGGGAFVAVLLRRWTRAPGEAGGEATPIT